MKKAVNHLFALRPWLIIAAALCLTLITSCGKASSTSEVVTLEELNRALGMAAMSPGGAIHTISDLTNFPAFKGRKMPTPPPGKKLALDGSGRAVFAAE